MSNATKIKNRQAQAKRKAKELYYTENAVNVVTAALLLTLKTCYGFGNKRLGTVVESMHALLEEQADRRSTPQDLSEWTIKETGIDPREVWKI